MTYIRLLKVIVCCVLGVFLFSLYESDSKRVALLPTEGAFVVVSMQRSGSGLLISKLNSHQKITAEGEIFNKNSAPPWTYMNEYWKKHKLKHKDGISGFKFMLTHSSREFRSDIYKQKGVKKVFLKRRNVVKRYVSLLKSKKSRVYNWNEKNYTNASAKQREIAFKTQVEIDVANMLKHIKIIDDLYDTAIGMVKKAKAPYSLVYYEDLVGPKGEQALEQLQKFLGIPVVDLSSSNLDMTSNDLHDVIKNFDEVATALKGTKYEAMLYDTNF